MDYSFPIFIAQLIWKMTPVSILLHHTQIYIKWVENSMTLHMKSTLTFTPLPDAEENDTTYTALIHLMDILFYFY